MNHSTIYFISANQRKFVEINKIIPQLKQVIIDLPEIQSLDSHEVIRAKLVEAQKKGFNPCIVDDTSWEFEGLHGLPGTFAKYFREKLSDDEILTLLQATGSTKALAKTIIGYSENGNVNFFEGTVYGNIVRNPGVKGFAFDPIFQPLGREKTFAEMSREEKNEISMRGIAARKLKDFLMTND